MTQTRHIDNMEHLADVVHIATPAGGDKNGQQKTMSIEAYGDFAGDALARLASYSSFATPIFGYGKRFSHSDNTATILDVRSGIPVHKAGHIGCNLHHLKKLLPRAALQATNEPVIAGLSKTIERHNVAPRGASYQVP